MGVSEGLEGGVVDELGEEVEGGLAGSGGGVVEVAPDALEGGGADMQMELVEDAGGQEVEVLRCSELPADSLFDVAT